MIGISHISEPAPEPRPGSQRIRARLAERLDEFNERSGHPYRLSLSLGIADFPSSTTETLESMLARADEALYEQKRERRGVRN